MTKLEFLKGILTQFNLVFDIDGSDVYIDLQDSGFDPVTGAAISGIATETVNIDNIIAKEYTADI